MKLNPQRLNRLVFIDAHYPEWEAGVGELYRRWSADQIVETALASGAQALAFFTKDHFGNCYYPTRVGHRHRDIPEDFTGQVVNAARQRGLPLLLYYSVFADDYAARRFPQWRNQNPRLLNPARHTAWGALGLHQAYLDQMMLPQLREICEWYAPNGFFFDTMAEAEPCPCPECAAEFRHVHGIAMDLAALERDPRPWLTVQALILHKLYRQVCGLVRERLPEALLVCGFPASDPDQLPRFAELFDLSGFETTLHWIHQDAGYLDAGIQARHARTKPWPTTACHYAFLGCWGELTTKPEVMLETEMMSSLSHGVLAHAADYLRPWGRLEPETFARLGRIHARMRALEPWLLHARPLTHTAVLTYGPPATTPTTIGAAKALVEAHQLFDIVDETALDELATAPRKYAVLVVPSPQPLWQPDRWHKLRDWIYEGGHVIVEGSPLLCAEALCLSEALGIRPGASSPYSAFYVQLDGELNIPNAPETPLLVHERALRFELDGGRALCALVDPIDEWDLARGVTHRTSVLPPRTGVQGPAISINRFGAGTAVFVAGSLTRAYWAHSHPWLRDLLIAALRLLPAGPLEVDAPPWVDVSLMQVGDAWVLHMVQFCLSHGAGSEPGFWHGDHYHLIEQTRPLFDLPFRLRVPKPPQRLVLLPGREPLPFRYQDGLVSGVLPRLDLHTALSVEF